MDIGKSYLYAVNGIMYYRDASGKEFPMDPQLYRSRRTWLPYDIDCSVPSLAQGNDTSDDRIALTQYPLAHDGDIFSMSEAFNVGKYSLVITGPFRDDQGKADWYLDGVKTVSGQDWYGMSGSGLLDTYPNIIISTPGVHTLKAVVNGKNVASSGYFLNIGSVTLK